MPNLKFKYGLNWTLNGFEWICIIISKDLLNKEANTKYGVSTSNNIEKNLWLVKQVAKI